MTQFRGESNSEELELSQLDLPVQPQRSPCTCPGFVDTKINPNDTVREGGVHGRKATTVYA